MNNDARAKANALRIKAVLDYVRAHPGCLSDDIFKNTGFGVCGTQKHVVVRRDEAGVYRFYTPADAPEHCPHCHKQNPPGLGYCGKCGRSY
jgi:hypothetical protein